MEKKCCERDHDGDGNCDRHPPGHHRADVRAVILAGLTAMARDLDRFDQTTHGVLACKTFDRVVEAMKECYANPSAYNVSTLAQCIRLFVRQEGQPA